MYVPSRNDIIFLDFDPAKGKEIGKYRPALVLTAEAYNKWGLLICCPISTSMRGGSTEVIIENLDKPCVVVTNLIQTLSWRERKLKFITKAMPGVMRQVMVRLLPIIGADAIVEELALQQADAI